MAEKRLLQTLTLFRGQACPNTYVWSPFVTKLEARLRFENMSYQVAVGSPRTAPKGKIPYIEFETSDDGSKITMGDSAFITSYLSQNGYLTDLNASLTLVQRAQDLGIRCMMEDRAYWYAGREKWFDNYEVMRDNVLEVIPWPIRLLVGWLVRNKNVQTLHGQGTGRFTDEEVAELKEEVWEAVGALLAESRKGKETGSEPFWVMGGNRPTEADSTLFGFVAGSLVCDAAPITANVIKGHPVIVEYAERIHQRYFPEYDRWD